MSEKKVWHEEDKFWKVTFPVIFSTQRLAGTTKEVEQIVKLASMQEKSSVLDMGCGIGRHCLELARRGFPVTGVDRTQFYLKSARKRAKLEGLAVKFVHDDIRHFCRPEQFDTALNLFTSFGYFEDAADDQRVIANAWNSLRKGGSFLIDIIGKEILARNFRPKDWSEIDGVLLLEERKFKKNFESVQVRWVIIQGKTKEEVLLTVRLYSASELTALLKSCGFDSVEIYGNLAGDPYDINAQRLIAVAKKA